MISKGYCSIPVYKNFLFLLVEFLHVTFDRSGKFLLLSSMLALYKESVLQTVNFVTAVAVLFT